MHCDCCGKMIYLFPNCIQSNRSTKAFLNFTELIHVRFDLDLCLGILHVRPVAGIVSMICYTSEYHCLWQEKWAHHGHQVKCKNDFEGSEYFQGWTTHKVNCLCVYCCSTPAIKDTLFISVQYNWALMIEDWMKSPVGSEMEIWEVTNTMRGIYNSRLKLIDAFRLC